MPVVDGLELNVGQCAQFLFSKKVQMLEIALYYTLPSFPCQWLMDKLNVRQSAQFLFSKSTNVKIDRRVVICSFGNVVLPRKY